MSDRRHTRRRLDFESLESRRTMSGEPVLWASDVLTILNRGAVATRSEDAIIAVVDRMGRIVGVRIEQEVETAYQGRENTDLVFAIDGAVAKARTAAFFSNNQAPLTSRTVRFISQSTMTQREIESNPNISDPDSPLRGPGFVAPIGVGAHFPPDVAFTPPVDLFAIEHQSRDSAIHPGADGIKSTLGDNLSLSNRFDVDPASVPAAAQFFMRTFPESYGTQSGTQTTAQSRGIATLPGGMPLYKHGVLVGGVGVFFPGRDGYATFEQSFQHASTRGSEGPQSALSRTNAPKVLEAEFIAYFAARGTAAVPVSQFEGNAAFNANFQLPSGRIDLAGITLEIYGPNPTRQNPIPGAQRLVEVGRANGGGQGRNTGANLKIFANGQISDSGEPVPSGWLVNPRSSAVDAFFTSADVERIIQLGINEANQTRAAIRLDANGRPGPRTRMVLAVTDSAGEVLGLFRMPDATVFSVDVAVAKARNTSYYASPNDTVVQPGDRVDFDNNGVPDVPNGTAFTNRTFRFLALPRYPSGAAQGSTIGDFSILNSPGIDRNTAENSDPLNPLPASVYSSATSPVLAFDAFNVSRNFRDARNLKKQNGVVFFPGSTPIYDVENGNRKLVGGLGISGDGVDQDDVVTAAAQSGYESSSAIRADQYIVAGVRLPFQKANRNPAG
jgi:uncharacterized protein GlcG (DUF336 family)